MEQRGSILFLEIVSSDQPQRDRAGRRRGRR